MLAVHCCQRHCLVAGAPSYKLCQSVLNALYYACQQPHQQPNACPPAEEAPAVVAPWKAAGGIFALMEKAQAAAAARAAEPAVPAPQPTRDDSRQQHKELKKEKKGKKEKKVGLGLRQSWSCVIDIKYCITCWAAIYLEYCITCCH
jgi:hypothetical protein